MKNLQPLNKKIISIASLDESEEEKKYWLSKGHSERLNAVELNRRLVYGKDRVASRLQRSIEITDLTRS
ncbi:MAG: hypothetical protein V1874_09360 [Spirochaetota bacterium]